MMLSSSSPASSHELATGVQQLRGTIRASDLLDGLEPPLAALAASMLTSTVTRSVLSFFYEHDHLAVRLSDLAYRIGQNQDEVGQVLQELVLLGLLHYQSACGITFYQLNRSPEVVTLLDKVFAWRKQWQTKVQRLERMIG